MLEQLGGVGPALISGVLLAYGVAGVVGNFAAGALVSRAVHRTVLVLTALIAVPILVMAALGVSASTAPVLLVVWGLGYGGASVSAQMWLLAAAPRMPEAASALLVTTFNAGISAGALIGGLVMDVEGTVAVLWVSTGLLVLTIAVVTAAAISSHASRGSAPRTKGSRGADRQGVQPAPSRLSVPGEVPTATREYPE
ncbi:MFS transporter [Pseudonocardia spinosispora]|uniref:MFS transporter n=1 Tax=Pseudonocardia spinosispora TaxID=103441 RepID=UPI00041457CB|nr:MFS transporter [Pseudonocardia spinosispora]